MPTSTIPGKGSALVYQVKKEVEDVQGITLKHSTTKHAQTISILERTHASFEKALKKETSERRSICRRYVKIAVPNYNKSYHACIGCEPSQMFHIRVPYKVFDLKMGICPKKQSTR